MPGICGADHRDLQVTCLRCGDALESVDGIISKKDFDAAPGCRELSQSILELLHEKGTRETRSETISMPNRYYDIAEAVGYARGLLDALRIVGEESQLSAVFQHTIAHITNPNETNLPADLRNLIKSASTGDCIDWVIEAAMPALKKTLSEDFLTLDILWANDPDTVRGWRLSSF